MNLLRYTLALPLGDRQIVEGAVIPRVGDQIEIPSGDVLPVLSVRHRLAETWEENEARRADGTSIVVILGSRFRRDKPDFAE